MTSYKVLLKTRLGHMINKGLLTDYPQAEFVLRKAIIEYYGGLFITPLPSQGLFLDSTYGTLLGQIVSVDDYTTHERVNAEFARRMEEYHAANCSETG